jgi:MtrB/PioB family decaheme-associated outer membrane protein
MKMRAGLLVTCAASALVVGMGFPYQARAADVMVTKAPPLAAPAWWYEGYVEIGGRFFLNNPDKTTLGKFYEYRDLRPGPFGNFYIAAHRTDPLDYAIWGKNVGYDDQVFGFDFTQPGKQYLSLGWDQTPHVFAKNAKTLYNGVGTNVLSIPDAVRTALSAAGPSAAAKTIVDANSRVIDLEYRRDTASVQYRWTPSDNWDAKFNYSHTHRHGTQPLGAVSFSGAGGTRSTFEIPKPVDDVTQNGNFTGSYAGSTPWGKPFNVALGYGFSLYDNADNAVSFQNPWNPANAANRPLWNRYSLPPSNQAQTVSLSGGVGLPWKSRYMGTFQYTLMQQNEAFLPWSINPAVPAVAITASSLNGEASTLLFNNVLHTQITSDLKSTLRYRYYDYDSDHSSISVLPQWFGSPDSTIGPKNFVKVAMPSNFRTQDGSAGLTWRAMRWLTMGGGYEWQRWDREFADVNVTNEHTVKAFADAKPWNWSTLRASIQYGERRYVGDYTTDLALNTANNVAPFRIKNLSNRDRTKGQISWAIDALPNITVTPLAGFRTDDYRNNILTEFGLFEDRSWHAGGDIAWNLSQSAHLYVSFIHENGYRQVYTRNNATIPANLNMETRDRTNTFIVGSKFTVIPDKLLVDANYTYSKSTSQWDSNCGPVGCMFATMPVFPDSHNTLQRFDVQAKYFLDPALVRSAGWIDKAFVTVRLLWEKNESDAWQPLQQQLGWAVTPADATMSRSIWMGIGSPNYNVALGSVSFGVKW